jgi:hypothetical protein
MSPERCFCRRFADGEAVPAQEGLCIRHCVIKENRVWGHSLRDSLFLCVKKSVDAPLPQRLYLHRGLEWRNLPIQYGYAVKGGEEGPAPCRFIVKSSFQRAGRTAETAAGAAALLEADYNSTRFRTSSVTVSTEPKTATTGCGNNRNGKDGNDLVIKVPPGTSVYDEEGDIIADLVESGSRCLVGEGGIGGRGNAFFKSSTHQTPRFAQPGMEGRSARSRSTCGLSPTWGLSGFPSRQIDTACGAHQRQT